MYVFHRISLPVHGLVELTAGLALVIGSLALPVGPAGTFALFIAGVIVAGVGLGAADSLPIAAHQSLDRWTATATAVASIALGLTGEATGALVLAAVAVGQLVLSATTHWTRSPART